MKLLVPLLVVAVVGGAFGQKQDATKPVSTAVNTKTGPQSQQDLRFSPAIVGSLLNAGSQILNSALGGRPGHNSHNHGHQGHQGGFGHNQGGHSHGLNFGGRPNRPHRPHRPHRPNRPIGFGQGGFGLGGFGQGGFGQGGFGHGGFGQGGFGQGGFGQGGFGQGGFGQGGFGQGGFGQGGFGQKGGSCPPVRAQCPLRGSFGPPQSCQRDSQCTGADKCCPDKCLREKVCKPAENVFG